MIAEMQYTRSTLYLGVTPCGTWDTVRQEQGLSQLMPHFTPLLSQTSLVLAQLALCIHG